MSEPRPVTGPESDGLDPLGDGERLPWLEPYREAKPPPAARPLKAPVSKNAAPPRLRSGMLLGGVLAAGLLAAGSYWFGRETAPRDVIRPQTTVIAPLPPAAMVQPQGEAPALPYRSLGDQPAEPVATQVAAPAPHRIQPRLRHYAKPTVRIHRHAVPPPPPPAPPQPRVVAEAGAPVAPVTVAPVRPAPVRVAPPPPSVGKPGDVIELGVFISPRTARTALHRIVRRYPYLGTRPKMILSQPPAAGWPHVYRLRLGTGSARNAKILCRYVHTIGKRCAVV